MKNNYASKVVNVSIVYDLDNCPISLLNNFVFKNCLFGATNIVKNSENSGYGKAFDGAGSWSFGNGFVRNIAIFGVDKSLSSHTDNRNNNFLVLGKEPTDDINGSIGTADKNFNINFSKAKTKFCLSLH